MAGQLQVRTMTTQETVKDLRSHGFPIGVPKLKAGIEQGVFPFGKMIQMENKEYLIYRRLYEQWLKEHASYEEE